LASCADIVHGTHGYSMDLKLEALATLANVASAGMANEAGLLQITSMCEEALPQHELKTSIFKAIEAVVLNSPSDPELIEAVLRVSTQLFEGSSFSQVYGPDARVTMDVLGVISRFPSHVGCSDSAMRGVLGALRLIVKGSQLAYGYFSVRMEAMLLIERIAPRTQVEPLRLEILDFLAFCAGTTTEEAMLSSAGRSLETLATTVGDDHLEVVVGVAGLLSAQEGAQRALITVVKRLTAGGHRDRAEGVLELLAKSFEARAMSFPLPCGRVVAVLRDLQPEAPLHTALRGRRRTALSPEIVMAVDDIVPPLPAERARARIVETCAKQSAVKLRHARAVLLATCLQPMRVGLGAARAFAAIVRERGGRSLSGVVGPADFAETGRCLLHAARVAEAGLGGVGAAEAERVAAELVDASVALLEHWRPDRRRLALRGLCALAGVVHSACLTEQ